METTKLTFDIYFHDLEASNNKGFSLTRDEAMNYINQHNGTNESYFKDYKGGFVQIVCNETQEVAHEEEIY